MGEQVYTIEGIRISFSEGDYSYGCLCAAFSAGINVETVRSLALLGAAVVLAHREVPTHQDEDSGYRYLPYYVPLKIRDAIDEVIYGPRDDLEDIAKMLETFYTAYPLEAAKKKEILDMIKDMHD